MEHHLHKIIGEGITSKECPNCKIIKDTACGGKQHIPLFCSEKRSRETEYCNVDLLITADNKAKIIIEIEEANIKPTQICGKFLTSALSFYYIYDNTPVKMDDSVLFIQILDTSKLKEGTSKTGQWENLEESINNILPIGNIREYKLIHGNASEFENRGTRYVELIECINGALGQKLKEK